MSNRRLEQALEKIHVYHYFKDLVEFCIRKVGEN
jgi:hypothetical protein